MPAPGTIKRRPFSPQEIALLLQSQFSLPVKEGLAYLKLVETRETALEDIAAAMEVSQNEAVELTKRMIARGLIIEAPSRPSRFIPLHPRMMLTNLFKTYEAEVVRALRERRSTVDKIVVLLTPVFEEREIKKD